MRTKLNALLLGALVLFGWAAGCAGVQKPLELTLQAALEIALEQNLNFRLATLDWQAARRELERAQIVGDEEMLIQAEKGWAEAEQAYREKTRELQDLVRTSYQELLQSETTVQNAQAALERAQKQLALDENKYKAGLLSALDIERSQNSLFDAEHRLERAVVDLETKRMRFNEALGLPLTEQVVLTERLLLDFVPFTLSLETCYQLALDLDQGVVQAQANLQKAQEAVAAAHSPFTPLVELERALMNREKAEIALLQAEQALYFRIRSQYYGLLDQVHALELLERNLELERKALQAEESKYAAGVISNAEIVAKQERLAQLEQEYSQNLFQYSLARIKLLQAMGAQEGETDEN